MGQVGGERCGWCGVFSSLILSVWRGRRESSKYLHVVPLLLFLGSTQNMKCLCTCYCCLWLETVLWVCGWLTGSGKMSPLVPAFSCRCTWLHWVHLPTWWRRGWARQRDGVNEFEQTVYKIKGDLQLTCPGMCCLQLYGLHLVFIFQKQWEALQWFIGSYIQRNKKYDYVRVFIEQDV